MSIGYFDHYYPGMNFPIEDIFEVDDIHQAEDIYQAGYSPCGDVDGSSWQPTLEPISNIEEIEFPDGGRPCDSVSSSPTMASSFNSYTGQDDFPLFNQDGLINTSTEYVSPGEVFSNWGNLNPLHSEPMSMPGPAVSPRGKRSRGNSTSSGKGPSSECPQCGKNFHRSTDAKRHFNTVHFPRFFDCKYSNCARKGSNGFTRKDHYREHCREHHKSGDPKRQRTRAN